MPLNIPVSELQQAAKKQVYDARKHNRLSSLTPRIIRQVLERKFNLEEGTLDEDEFKALRAQLKSAITEATVSGRSLYRFQLL
ncbi:hypothetical protein K438DRAFT_286055 [Mycena galopus ATCC 62051]|nr:hypothetical protein K438DRAFT_286055 [Mycena galopus ATCC 62051]